MKLILVVARLSSENNPSGVVGDESLTCNERSIVANFNVINGLVEFTVTKIKLCSFYLLYVFEIIKENLYFKNQFF